MKRIGWAIALAAAAMTPAAAAAPTATPGTAEAPANAATAAPAIPSVPADAEFGVPRPGALGLQEQVTDIGREAAAFHNVWLLTLCALISLLVLALLAYTMVR